MGTIWIYRVPGEQYMIAKRSPFSDYSQSMDYRSAQLSYTLLQGVPMPEPVTWDWKQKHAGRTFAGFGVYVYDITDLDHMYFMRPK
jgi:hypothetical protein